MHRLLLDLRQIRVDKTLKEIKIVLMKPPFVTDIHA